MIEGVDYITDKISRHSMVVSLGLECDSLKVSLLGTMVSIGYIIGAYLYHYVLKLLGQKKTLFIMNIIFFLLQLGTIFIKNFYYLIIVMFINSVIPYMFQEILMLLIQKISSLKHVSIYTGIMTSGYNMGGILFSLLFWGIKKWEFISFINVGMVIINTIFIYIFCLDSFSQMFDEGKMDKFKKGLKFIANINGQLEEYEKNIINNEYNEKFERLF